MTFPPRKPPLPDQERPHNEMSFALEMERNRFDPRAWWRTPQDPEPVTVEEMAWHQVLLDKWTNQISRRKRA